MRRFHYIVAGAGCAGLSLLVRLLRTGQFADKKILLIDKAPKTANDRTWCYWEERPGFFEPIVYKSWDKLWYYGPGHESLHNIAPYRYKMIRAVDFYRYCMDEIKQHPNVTIEYTAVQRIDQHEEGAILYTEHDICYADHIFSSILFEKPILKKKQYYLLQHFKGWVIETPQPSFNPAEATLMDFRIPQDKGTAFVYVMPFTPTRALIEYTLFTEALLEPQQYDFGLKEYINRFLHIKEYTIAEEEFGMIPMTNYTFPVGDKGITYLGTAGGQTKASSGYTFQFIQKQTAQLVQSMVDTGQPTTNNRLFDKRFGWYDATLLNILVHNKWPGAAVFTTLFSHNKASAILRFLDNETTLLQELNIIKALPKKIFIRAALQQLF